jgi:hypothetical protein
LRLCVEKAGLHAAKFAHQRQPVRSCPVKPGQTRSNQKDWFDRNFRRPRTPERPSGGVPCARTAVECGTQFRFGPVPSNSHPLLFQRQITANYS